MKINSYMKSEQGIPHARWPERSSKCSGRPALILTIVTLTVAFVTGCSSTGGANVHFSAPAASSRQSPDPADDGWYHPPESPAVAPFA